MFNPANLSRGLLIAAALCTAGMAACSSSPVSKRDAEVRNNPTPELETLSERPIDVANDQAVTVDENLRMANEDWNRFWLMDRPSRLERWRMPH